MTDKSDRERIGILETKVEHLDEKVVGIVKAREVRGLREWAVIMSIISLLLAFIAKKLGIL